jgi:hypothetical protein
MTGIKVALIVFVCLTVASLAFAVILFTHQADLDQAVASAQDRASQAGKERSDMQQQVSEIARLVTGDSTSETSKIQASIAAAIKPVVNDPTVQQARVAPDSAAITVLQRLYQLYQKNAEELAKTTAQRDDLVKQLDQVNKAAEARAQEFAAKTTEFESSLKQAEEQAAAHQQAWTQQVENIKGSSGKTLGSTTTELSNARALIVKIEKQLEEKNLRLKELADKLARFQPGMDTVTPQQIADGTIVRSIPTENIVYISLGKRDRVTPGMPFSVYSRSPRDNNVQEKATVEVMNVFDNTAEARVKSSKPGDPIIEGDLIANLVYDRNKRYRFVVAGDFDLDFDGQIDQPGGVAGQDVARMIERWGGQVAPTLDSSIDFVVLGAPPHEPLPLPANATEEARQRTAEQTNIRQVFEGIRAEAKALSIPALTRTQFLHFIGHQVPPRTPEDQLAAQ